MLPDIKIDAETIDPQEARQASRRMDQFSRGEGRRHSDRFKKRMLKERLSGPKPDRLNLAQGKKIKDKLGSIGGHLKAFISGKKLDDLKIKTKISKFLLWHETGAEPKGKNRPDGFLYIRGDKLQGGARFRWIRGQKVDKRSLAKVFLRKRSVKIKARLGWAAMWDSMEPDLVRRLIDAVKRAIEMSFSKLKKV